MSGYHLTQAAVHFHDGTETAATSLTLRHADYPPPQKSGGTVQIMNGDKWYFSGQTHTAVYGSVAAQVFASGVFYQAGQAGMSATVTVNLSKAGLHGSVGFEIVDAAGVRLHLDAVQRAEWGQVSF